MISYPFIFVTFPVSVIKFSEKSNLAKERKNLLPLISEEIMAGVLVKVCIVGKRHEHHKDSCKGKPIIGAGLQSNRFTPLSSW